MVGSARKKGLFCRYCVLFVGSTVVCSGNNIELKKLVTVPLTSFSKIAEANNREFSLHRSHSYHQRAVTSGEDFCPPIENPTHSIQNRLDSDRKRRVLENREKLVPIVETIILCGR